MGWVRARISPVASRRGDSQTMSIAVPSANTMPPSSASSERPIIRKSTTHNEKPSCTIGPISGEMSIAPITTAADDCSRPRMAMPQDITAMNAKRGVSPPPSVTLPSTAA
ncbi:hypothetical protein D3C71_1641360 [compost metagenome]